MITLVGDVIRPEVTQESLNGSRVRRKAAVHQLRCIVWHTPPTFCPTFSAPPDVPRFAHRGESSSRNTRAAVVLQHSASNSLCTIPTVLPSAIAASALHRAGYVSCHYKASAAPWEQISPSACGVPMCPQPSPQMTLGEAWLLKGGAGTFDVSTLHAHVHAC